MMISTWSSFVLLVLVCITSPSHFLCVMGEQEGDDGQEVSLDRPFTSSSVFRNLEHSPCVTLFHRHGQQGCGTASRETQIGHLVPYRSTSSSTSTLQLQSRPFVIVLEEDSLSHTNVQTLLERQDRRMLQGILVLNATKSSSSANNNNNDNDNNKYYSPMIPTPNGKRTPSQYVTYGNSAYQWNTRGDNLVQLNTKGVPMAYVRNGQVSRYLAQELFASSSDQQQQDAAYGNRISSIKAEINYYMGPTSDMDSPTCLSWKDKPSKTTKEGEWNPKCLPLGGNSVWARVGYFQQNQNQDAGRRRLEDKDNKRQAILLATAIDSNNLFHDTMPAANSAASNILTLLMASKLLGQALVSPNNNAPVQLEKDIIVGFFQGESFGFVGSRRFLKDVIQGFQCQKGPVPANPQARDAESEAKSKAEAAGDENSDSDADDVEYEQACLYPMRPSLEFQKLNQEYDIAGMIAVDQVGALTNNQNLYIHRASGGGGNDDGDGDNDNDFANFVSEVLQASAGNEFSISEMEVQADDDHFNNNDFTVPPSPLTSLLSLTGGAVGGVVLTGFSDSFNPRAYYGSHLDSIQNQKISFDAIATAATALARTALAAALVSSNNDNGDNDNNNNDADAAAAQAKNIIGDNLSADNETMQELIHCLFYDGNCPFLSNYAAIEGVNTKLTTGLDMGVGLGLGRPPNYYTNVLGIDSGQPFVQVSSGKFYRYGAYNEDDYGKHKDDTVAVRPKALEMALRGMLNDFLGRPPLVASGNDENAAAPTLTKCRTTKECSGKIPQCMNSNGDAVCTGGGVCVCSVAHYHVALDEGLEAAPNNRTGYYQLVSNDDGISAMYSEPYWSADVGVRIYRDAGKTAGGIALIVGVVAAAACIALVSILKRRMIRHKLY